MRKCFLEKVLQVTYCRSRNLESQFLALRAQHLHATSNLLSLFTPKMFDCFQLQQRSCFKSCFRFVFLLVDPFWSPQHSKIEFICACFRLLLLLLQFYGAQVFLSLATSSSNFIKWLAIYTLTQVQKVNLRQKFHVFQWSNTLVKDIIKMQK